MTNVKRVIFVCGTARSGSTILNLTLSNLKQCFGSGEMYAYFRPWRRHHGSIECSCGEQTCGFWNAHGAVSESVIHNELLKATGSTCIIDSSKNLNWTIDAIAWCRAHDIEHNVVLTWKDGFELRDSFEKRGRSDWFKKFDTYHSRFIDLGIPFVSVKYKDLAADPKNVLKHLCDLLGEEFDDDILNFEGNEFHFLFGSAGVRTAVIDSNISFRSSSTINDDELGLSQENARKYEALCNSLQEKDIFLKTNIENTCNWQVPTFLPAWYYLRRVRDTITKYLPFARKPAT